MENVKLINISTLFRNKTRMVEHFSLQLLCSILFDIIVHYFIFHLVFQISSQIFSFYSFYTVKFCFMSPTCSPVSLFTITFSILLFLYGLNSFLQFFSHFYLAILLQYFMPWIFLSYNIISYLLKPVMSAILFTLGWL